jgi:hypothetical protein
MKPSTMLRTFFAAAALCALTIGSVAFPASASAAAYTRAITAPAAERYLHVRVEDADKGESVNVNLPLSIAEKILPTINRGELHNGRVSIHNMDVNEIDIRALLDAVRSAEDNEFVTVKQKDQEVRVAKSKGNLVVHVVEKRENAKHGQNVDVTVPMKVIDALISTTKNNELDVVAALHALADAGDAVLVTVQDATQHVRIWVDSKSSSE